MVFLTADDPTRRVERARQDLQPWTGSRRHLDIFKKRTTLSPHSRSSNVHSRTMIRLPLRNRNAFGELFYHQHRTVIPSAIGSVEKHTASCSFHRHLPQC